MPGQRVDAIFLLETPQEKTMLRKISSFAGKHLETAMLVDIPALITAYHTCQPDPAVIGQRVAFGTSGHRGSSCEKSFNAWHIFAITQAICDYRAQQHITGPLFLGMDTHALSAPAYATALEVLAANGVHVMRAENTPYTPTPVISHAILCYNRGRTSGLADGIVITPSHNPPEDGGFKYNPPHGGPADSNTTDWIQARANYLLETQLAEVKRIPYEKALAASTTHAHDYLHTYVEDLQQVIDMEAIRSAGLHIGVDAMGGAGLDYWAEIAARYALDLTVMHAEPVPTFSFMSADWDGQLRMDPSSSYAMEALIARKRDFDIAFACDTDHDRHGIVTPGLGLMPSNSYLSVAIDYLFQHRPHWPAAAAIGKTVVSSQMIDRVAAKLARTVYEVPVGFKWFVEGLQQGVLGFAGEESAGASFLRRDGGVWTTDKDGIVAGLLSAEITARTGRDPGECYQMLAAELGASFYTRIDVAASAVQKAHFKHLTAQKIQQTVLAGDPIDRILTQAPGNQAPIGGIKVITRNGWFAARPSGTEEMYKIYAESFQTEAHLQEIIRTGQGMIDEILGSAGG
jgi:phosphoglucomutase